MDKYEFFSLDDDDDHKERIIQAKSSKLWRYLKEEKTFLAY